MEHTILEDEAQSPLPDLEGPRDITPTVLKSAMSLEIWKGREISHLPC
ncbi:hypothetical protein OROGR_023020 [Orobanche gracilis]